MRRGRAATAGGRRRELPAAVLDVQHPRHLADLLQLHADVAGGVVRAARRGGGGGGGGRAQRGGGRAPREARLQHVGHAGVEGAAGQRRRAAAAQVVQQRRQGVVSLARRPRRRLQQVGHARVVRRAVVVGAGVGVDDVDVLVERFRQIVQAARGHGRPRRLLVQEVGQLVQRAARAQPPAAHVALRLRGGGSEGVGLTMDEVDRHGAGGLHGLGGRRLQARRSRRPSLFTATSGTRPHLRGG